MPSPFVSPVKGRDREFLPAALEILESPPPPAPIALIAIQAIQQAKSTAKLYTFDTNAALVAKVKSGAVQWAVDQQPYLQGYEAIDSLWLYLTNADVIGGGQTVLTGPAFVDSSNIAQIAQYAERGTR